MNINDNIMRGNQLGVFLAEVRIVLDIYASLQIACCSERDIDALGLARRELLQVRTVGTFYGSLIEIEVESCGGTLLGSKVTAEPTLLANHIFRRRLDINNPTGSTKSSRLVLQSRRNQLLQPIGGVQYTWSCLPE